MRLSILILALLAGNAIAWENPYEYRPRMPRTTNSYDPATGNMTNTYRHADGSSDTYGINPRTGSQWNSRSDRRGNQSGTDADGNTWNYNRDTNTYFNHGTGEMCTGSGYARVCF